MSDLVRSSREGDRYHHLWGARYAIELIRPGTSLVRIALEGAAAPTKSSPKADYAIDLALYWRRDGQSEDEELIQFKYSTRSAPPSIAVGTIASVLTGWAGRFADDEAGPHLTKLRVVTNRGFSDALVKAVTALAAGKSPTQHSKPVQKAMAKLRSATARLSAKQRRAFFSILTLDESDEDVGDIERSFKRAIAAHDAAPSTRRDKELALADLIEMKAGYPGRSNRNLIDADAVLATLRVDSKDELYPAPDAHEVAANLIQRPCTTDIASAIVSDERPCLVHAKGGLGKSELIRQLGPFLPAGSELIIFDGFGAGRYSQPDDHRHQHCRGLLQILNDLACRGLSDLHLPSESSPAFDWAREFRTSVVAASAQLAAFSDGALLVIVMDAADNTVDAARSNGVNAFVSDVFDLSGLPANVRLVATCRTERRDRLASIAEDRQIPVPAFTIAETGAHVRSVFPDADDRFVEQFSARTGGNPRVQFFALQHAVALGDAEAVWQLVGDTPLEPQESLDRIFAKFVEEAGLRNGAPAHVRAILQSVATLPKPIPVDDLAAVAGVSPSEVQSCIGDLRGMIASESGGVSIRDEPTEFFLSKHYATAADRSAAIGALGARRESSVYANLALPRLLLSDDRRAELYALAQEQHQPACIKQEREWRRLRLARARGALAAALRARDYGDASKLAAIAAVLAAEANEALAFITKAPELIYCAAHPSLVIDHVRRDYDPSWIGSRYTVLAALNALSGNGAEAMVWFRRGLADIHASIDARPRPKRRDESYGVDDCANLALTLAKASSPEAAIKWVAGWKPALWGYRIARALGDKASNLEDGFAEKLAECEADHVQITLGLCGALIDAGRQPPPAAVARLVRQLSDVATLFDKKSDGFDYEHERARMRARSDGLNTAEAALDIDRSVATAIAETFAMEAKDTRSLRFPGSPVSNDQLVFQSVALRRRLLGDALGAADFAGHLEEAYKARKADDMPGATFHEWVERTNNYTAQQFRADISAGVALYGLRARAFEAGESEAVFAEALAGLSSKSTFQSGAREHAVQRLQFQCCYASAIRSEKPSVKLRALAGLANRMAIKERRILIGALARAGAAEDALALATGYDWAALEDSSTRRSTMGDFALAALSVSKADAQALFSQGWDLKSGDDEHGDPRTIASLAAALAAQMPAGAPPEPVLGRQVAHLIENAAIRTDVDKCPWSDFGRGIAALLQEEAFGSISTWSDRGHVDLLYPLHLSLIELVGRNKISLIEAAALLRLRPVTWHWAYPASGWVDEWLASAAAEKPALLRSLYQYWEEERETSLDKAMLDIFEKHNSAPALPDAAIGDRIVARKRFLELIEQDKSEDPPLRHASRDEQDERIAAIAAQVDASSAASIDAASEELKSDDGDRHLDRSLLALITERLSPDERRPFLEALLQTRSLGRWALEFTFRDAREAWSVKHLWMEEFLRNSAKSFAAQIQRGEDDPGSVARALIDDLGITDAPTAYKHALDVFADAAADANSGALVSAAVLAAKLSPANAVAACQAVVAEIPELVAEADVSPAPPRPNGVEPLALFLWAQMGDWKSERRWEATASVRELARRGLTSILDQLSLLWSTAPAGYTRDHSRFRIGDARHHFLIALEAVVFDGGALNAPLQRHLKDHALCNGHLLYQLICARTLSKLNADGRLALVLTDGEIATLQRTADKAWPVTITADEFYPGPLDNSEETVGAFHFDFDFVESYLDPVCEAFSVTRAELAPRVATRVRAAWPNLANSYEYEEWRRGDYEDFHMRHGGAPKQSGFGFSAAFHALWEVAGELIHTHPVTNARHWADRWNSWLARFERAYPDGWIVDHERPAPLNLEARGGARNYGSSVENGWPWAFDAMHFQRCITPHDRPGALSIAGSWSLTRHSNSTEKVTIESALIATSDARDLMAALQHTDTSQWRLPTIDEESSWRRRGLPAASPLLDRVEIQGQLEAWYPRQNTSHQFYRLAGAAAEILAPHALVDVWEDHCRLTCDNDAIVNYLRESEQAMLISVLIARPSQGDYNGERSARFGRVYCLSADGSLSYCTSVEPAASSDQKLYGLDVVKSTLDRIRAGAKATFKTAPS